MYKTESDYLTELFYEDGSIKTVLTPVFNNIAFIGKQVRGQDGRIRLHDTVQERFDSITDVQGNYIYVRYRGEKEVLSNSNRVKTPLRLVIVLLDRNDIDLQAVNIVKFIKANSNVFSGFTINTNTFEVFTQELGLPTEELKKSIFLAYIDFNCNHSLPTCAAFEAI